MVEIPPRLREDIQELYNNALRHMADGNIRGWLRDHSLEILTGVESLGNADTLRGFVYNLVREGILTSPVEDMKPLIPSFHQVAMQEAARYEMRDTGNEWGEQRERQERFDRGVGMASRYAQECHLREFEKDYASLYELDLERLPEKEQQGVFFARHMRVQRMLNAERLRAAGDDGETPGHLCTVSISLYHRLEREGAKLLAWGNHNAAMDLYKDAGFLLRFVRNSIIPLNTMGGSEPSAEDDTDQLEVYVNNELDLLPGRIREIEQRQGDRLLDLESRMKYFAAREQFSVAAALKKERDALPDGRTASLVERQQSSLADSGTNERQ